MEFASIEVFAILFQMYFSIGASVLNDTRSDVTEVNATLLWNYWWDKVSIRCAEKRKGTFGMFVNT